MDSYVNLAKKTVKEYVKTGKIISPPDNLPKEMLDKRAGVFVSLHAKSEKLRGLPRRHALATAPHRIVRGEQVSVLRGCIGTYLPTRENIGQEIIKNAIESATSDPRFPPITKEELPSLIYSVDVLSEPKPAKEKDLDPKKYGLIVVAKDACPVSRAKRGIYGGRRGLLLPDLEGVDTVGQQIAICRQKAWIAEDEPVTLYRFTVERHGKK